MAMQHVRVAVTILLLGLSIVWHQSPNSPANSPQGKASKRGATRKTEPQTMRPAVSQPDQIRSAPQRTEGNCPPAAPAAASAGDPRESFSELTLFLFASALALFVALLGWSDQIRGIDKDTKELEARFLEETGIAKRDFLCVVKPTLQGEQLLALTKLMKSGGMQSHVKVDLLSAFRAWNKEWSRLERISVWKYNLTVALTLALFVAGTISLFTHPNDQVRLHFFSARAEMLVLTLPMSLIVVLLGIIIYGSRRENALRALLDSMADKV
jgi:hypothetical protein